MTLRKSYSSGRRGDKRIISTSIGVLCQYSLQAILGLFLIFLFMVTFMPGLFPAFGFLLPLGFAQGPGQAYAIGRGWEAFRSAGAGSVSLTFAAVGFLWACFGGVFLINYGIRKGWSGNILSPSIKKE